MAARTAALESEIAELRSRQIEAPAVHQLLHLHGVTPEDAAAIAARQNTGNRPELEENYQ